MKSPAQYREQTLTISCPTLCRQSHRLKQCFIHLSLSNKGPSAGQRQLISNTSAFLTIQRRFRDQGTNMAGLCWGPPSLLQTVLYSVWLHNVERILWGESLLRTLIHLCKSSLIITSQRLHLLKSSQGIRSVTYEFMVKAQTSPL